MRERKMLVAGCLVFFLYVIIATFAPAIAPYDLVYDRDLPYLSPSFRHILGTNDIGQDIFSEFLIATRQSLLVGGTAAFISLLAGIVFGVFAGWFGGAADKLLSAVSIFFLTIPFFPLVILLASMVGGNTHSSAIILGLFGWPETARILRSQTIALRERQYILDIRAMGAKDTYILTRHIARELLPMAAYRFLLSFRSGILAESTLSFLGLGSPVSKSWGNMLYYAQAKNAFLTGAWKWWVLPPGFALAGLVFALLLVSYYFEGVLDPRIGGRVNGGI